MCLQQALTEGQSFPVQGHKETARHSGGISLTVRASGVGQGGCTASILPDTFSWPEAEASRRACSPWRPCCPHCPLPSAPKPEGLLLSLYLLGWGVRLRGPGCRWSPSLEHTGATE